LASAFRTTASISGLISGVQLTGRQRSLAYVLVGDAYRGIPNERRSANEQLIKQAARGVQVAA
jgi:hypothetical protein